MARAIGCVFNHRACRSWIRGVSPDFQRKFRAQSANPVVISSEVLLADE